jgi:hypothetical protein
MRELHVNRQARPEEGYWRKHMAVGEFDMMGMHFKPGTKWIAYHVITF